MRLGIDLGGTKIEICALDDRRQTLLRRRVATPAGDYEATLVAIAALVRDAEEELGPAQSVGIGIPGAPSRSDGRIKNANSTVLIGRPFVSDIECVLGRSVAIANDANCLALSEVTDGAGVGCTAVFAAILGTGVGGAFAVRGAVLEGRNAIAGEWGHNPLPWPRDAERPGPACYCGKRGCIETFLSGPRLSEQYRELAGTSHAPTEIASSAAGGDVVAQRVMAEYEDRFARALATVVNVLDPDAIVVGGGLSNIERLYANVPPLLARYVFSDVVLATIVPALHGDSSGVRGAAMLAASSDRC